MVGMVDVGKVAVRDVECAGPASRGVYETVPEIVGWSSREGDSIHGS
jgi:hypothetical protein